MSQGLYSNGNGGGGCVVIHSTNSNSSSALPAISGNTPVPYHHRRGTAAPHPPLFSSQPSQNSTSPESADGPANAYVNGNNFFSGNDFFASQATQATQPPVTDDTEIASPAREQPPTIPPGVYGKLIPIDELAKTELNPKMLIGSIPFKIGRGGGSQLQIQDMTISSKHCSLVLDESNGSVCILDHRSSNGTFVNAERVEPEKKYYLSHGDCVSLVAPGKQFASLLTNNDNDGGSAGTSTAAEQQNGGGNAKKPRTLARSVGFSMMYHAIPPPSGFAEEANRKAAREFSAKYAILEELGKGQFATVYRAMSRLTGEKVAVKVIERSRFLTMNASRWAQQVREAEVLRSLEHPYIVSFRGLVHTPDTLYVITELLEGGELFDRLVNFGAYPEQKARILIRKICEAVAYLHEKGIVHRDLKPENIVMKRKGDDLDVKVVDFGVATEVEEGRGRRTFCGSLSYVAPEVLRRKQSVLKKGTYGKAVDMWSIGVIVYVVLTLRPPFDDEDSQMHTALKHILQFTLPEWSNISRSAKNFVARCFEMDETKRMTASQALDHEWLSISY
jgi:predicted Ser/Thr protein kinase